METATSIPENKKMTKWRNPFKPVLDNPVILKELRGRMRGRQAFILLTVYLGLIAVFILLVYNLLGLTSSITWDPSARQGAGKAIFGTVVLLELLLLSFIAPGLTAGAITSERERQTFEILRTTLLSARSLVLGKLSSALSFLFLLILSALPIQSLAFLLGGVGLGEMIASSLMLVVTAVFFCTLGIFFSSFMKRTLSATVASYAVILLTFLILVVIFFLVAYVESFSYNTFGSQAMEYLLTVILWFLISTNPLMAAVISEVILVDQQSLFYTSNSLFGSSGPSILISPWLIYVVFYLFLTVVLILLSIYFVKRPDR
jgi:ABC-type transport system involved in multi-copper enzyme maturation permease subunit